MRCCLHWKRYQCKQTALRPRDEVAVGRITIVPIRSPLTSTCTPGILRATSTFLEWLDSSIRNSSLPTLPIFYIMVRSATDSTRFTPTGVWAHTKPGASVRASTLEFAEPAPKNETPQQKVKRLREAANRAKLAQITKWDWAYFYGRMAADMAHKGTVYGIIFATGTPYSKLKERIEVLLSVSIPSMMADLRRLLECLGCVFNRRYDSL